MVATRGRLFSVFRNPRTALHLENKSSAYTPKSAGSALMIGKIALMMLVAVGMRCQNKLSHTQEETANSLFMLAVLWI